MTKTPTAQTADIRSDGHRYYIGIGCSRRRETYKTWKGAKRAAEARGLVVVGDEIDNSLPSASHLVRRVDRADGFGIEFTCPDAYVKVAAESCDELNKVLKKLGYRPIRASINLQSGAEFFEDLHTPGYLSPRSEQYWSN